MSKTSIFNLYHADIIVYNFTNHEVGLTFTFLRLKQGPYLKFTAPDGATPLLAQLKVIGSVCRNNRSVLGSYEYDRQFLTLFLEKRKLIRSILKKCLKPLFRPHFKKATESLQYPYNKIRQET